MPELRAAIVVPDTIVATMDGNGYLTFTVPLSIHNNGDQLLKYTEYCNQVIQEPNRSGWPSGEDGWRTVYAPICAAVWTPPRLIQPGETFIQSVMVGAKIQGATYPNWMTDHTTGTYRVGVGLIPGEGPLPGGGIRIPNAGSNSFVLIQR